MRNHTEGPWSFYTDPQPNGCPIVGARGMMVAMLAHTINRKDQREMAIANARLIAAAPDLMDALLNLTDHCRRMGFDTREEEPLLRAAEDAIFKATGEQA